MRRSALLRDLVREPIGERVAWVRFRSERDSRPSERISYILWFFFGGLLQRRVCYQVSLVGRHLVCRGSGNCFL